MLKNHLKGNSSKFSRKENEKNLIKDIVLYINMYLLLIFHKQNKKIHQNNFFLEMEIKPYIHSC